LRQHCKRTVLYADTVCQANNAAAKQEYDGLNRLKDFRRGLLAAGKRSVENQRMVQPRASRWPESSPRKETIYGLCKRDSSYLGLVGE